MEIDVNSLKSKDLYRLLTSTITPRPIAFVSTKDEKGISNLKDALSGASDIIAGKLAGVMIAVNGGWVLAPIGAAIGWLGIKVFDKNKEKK